MIPEALLYVLSSKEIAAIGILAINILLAVIVATLAKRYLRVVTKKAGAELADLLIRALGKPLFAAIVLAGVYLSLQTLPQLEQYHAPISLVFAIISALLASLIIVRLLNASVDWYAMGRARKVHTKLDTHSLAMIHKAVYAVVYSIAALWLLRMLGVEITAIIAAVGVGGIAIALALQDTLSNLFAGAYVAIDRPVRIGDYVEIDATHYGYIVDIGWRSTRVRTRQDTYIVIPNSKLAGSTVVNYSLPREEFTVEFPVGVAYDSDLAEVEKTTIEVAKRMQQAVDGAMPDFEPSVRYRSFEDSNIKFTISLRAKDYTGKEKLVHEFVKALKERYDKDGIEISFPSTNVYMRK